MRNGAEVTGNKGYHRYYELRDGDTLDLTLRSMNEGKKDG